MKKPSVYIAILNTGTKRTEYDKLIMPRMMATPGVDVFLENPVKSRSVPVTSNRNGISKRYRAADHDYLLLLDDDTVPFDNPVELVFAKKDIIGCPYRIYQNGKLYWSAWIHNGEGYVAVDLDKTVCGELLAVDVVATGCILIKRKVLEQLKAPFNAVFDEDGIPKLAEDFNFCRRAKEAGFEIYTTPKRRCEHFKTVGVYGLEQDIKKQLQKC